MEILSTNSNTLVNTTWINRNDPTFQVTVVAEFRMANELEPWLDCRDVINATHMLRANWLVENFQKLGEAQR